MFWILLLAGLITAVVWFVREPKEIEIDSPESITTPKGEFLTKSVADKKPTECAAPVECVTIYEYAQRGTRKCCSCCDGENDRFAVFCSICGSRMEG